MAQFHSLTVTNVRKTTRDAVVVTLQPDNPKAFEFTQGQYLTFKRDFDGEELRRSYSICASPDDGHLKVGIKLVENGAFSSWANEELQPGDTLQAMQPMGKFHTPHDASTRHHYLAFAVGSGITPILSILSTTLAREPEARFTLIYANHAVSTIMFREELEDLKNRYMERLNIVHILNQDAQDIDLFAGRIDAKKCAALFAKWIPVQQIDTAFICGPEELMGVIATSLKDHGLTDNQIKYELFASSAPVRNRVKSVNRTAPSDDVAVTLKIDGDNRSFAMTKNSTLLEAALQNDFDAPHACKAGVCSTCMARVVEGEVEMVANHALEDYEVENGYILTCQSFPLSEKLVVDYDRD